MGRTSRPVKCGTKLDYGYILNMLNMLGIPYAADWTHIMGMTTQHIGCQVSGEVRERGGEMPGVEFYEAAAGQDESIRLLQKDYTQL